MANQPIIDDAQTPVAAKKVAVPQMTPTPTPIPIAPPALAATDGALPNTTGQAATPTIAAPASAPAPTPAPITPAPALAAAPPIAPASQTFDQLSAATASPNPVAGQPSGPTNDKGQPLGPDGQFHGAQGPTFTLGAGGQPVTVQQPNGPWTNADGSQLAAGTNQWGNPIATGPSAAPSSLSLPEMQAALTADAAKNPSGVQPPTVPPIAGASNDGGYVGSSGSVSPSDAPSIAPAAITAGARGPNLIDSTGAGDYTGKTIQPGAGVDRFGIAQSRFDDAAKASDPAYQKTLRDATSQAAGAGRLGSGMLRTSLGDAANLRNTQLDSLRSGFLNDALTGSIDDSYKDIGIAQQQQGFQKSQQDTAFDQEVRAQQLDEALRNGDFTRYYELLNAGNAGNPSDAALTLSNSYGNQASSAAQGASNLVGGAINANSQAQILAGQNGGRAPSVAGVDPNTLSPEELQRYLESLGLNGTPGYEQTPDYSVPPIATGGYPIYQPPKPVGA